VPPRPFRLIRRVFMVRSPCVEDVGCPARAALGGRDRFTVKFGMSNCREVWYEFVCRR